MRMFIRVAFLVTCFLFSAHAALTTQQLVTLTASNLLNISIVDGNYQFVSSGLPDHEVGDVNPNDATDADHQINIPMNPTEAQTPGCLELGTIGLAINGVPFYSPYTGDGYNAVEGENKETLDDCSGHPSPNGHYHYHYLSPCIWTEGTRDKLLGIALDGYLIYGPIDGDGNTLTSTDLDFCHGKVVDGVYRYHVTDDFPYILGCYHGVVLESNNQNGMTGAGEMGPPPGGIRPPPPGGNRPPPPGGMGGGGTNNPCVYANSTDVSDQFEAQRSGVNQTPGGGSDGGNPSDGTDEGTNTAAQLGTSFTIGLLVTLKYLLIN